MSIPLGILAVAGAGAAGLASSYDLLTTTLITSNTASVTFSNLGNYSDYKHLQIRYTGRTDRGSDNDTLYIRFNNNTSGYRAHFLMGDGTSVTSGDRGTGLTRVDIQGAFTGSTSTASNFGAGIIDILDFSSSSKNTTVRFFGGIHNSGNKYISLASGLWNNTAAVTEILIDKVASNFVSGTRVSLYGVK